MTNNPKISVIIPCYNGDKYLSQCVDSILAQTFTDFELLCVDDGSTDDTPKILACYAGKDNRVKVVTKANGGVSSARNAALDIARGEYICFVDADDYVHPDYLKIALNAITGEQADFAHINFQDVTYETKIEPSLMEKAKNSVIVNPLTDILPFKNDIFLASCAFVYKAKALGNIRFSAAIISEDILFNSRFLKRAQKGVLITEPLYFYRYNSTSTIHTKFSKDKALSYLSVAEDLYNEFKDTPIFLHKIRAPRINQNLKNVLKHIDELDDTKEVTTKIKDMYKRHIINFKGLSLSKRLTLLKIIMGIG